MAHLHSLAGNTLCAAQDTISLLSCKSPPLADLQLGVHLEPFLPVCFPDGQHSPSTGTRVASPQVQDFALPPAELPEAPENPGF